MAPLWRGSPRARRKHTVTPAALMRRRTLAVRLVSGHRLVALLEIVSAANKDRPEHVEEFVAKAVTALECGVHLLLVDLFPPGPPRSRRPVRRDSPPPGAIRRTLRPPGQRAGHVRQRYAAGTALEVFVEHAAVGATLPDMALFIRPDRYVNVPLEATYQAAYRGFPAFWRTVLEGGPA